MREEVKHKLEALRNYILTTKPVDIRTGLHVVKLLNDIEFELTSQSAKETPQKEINK